MIHEHPALATQPVRSPTRRAGAVLLRATTTALLIGVAGVWLAGCAHRVREPVLQSSIGRRVTLTGKAEQGPMGAIVHGIDFEVYIGSLQQWPAKNIDHQVRVIGVVEERNDLPVPPGGEVSAAHRFVLRDATWKQVH